jgi:hypothetical protein
MRQIEVFLNPAIFLFSAVMISILPGASPVQIALRSVSSHVIRRRRRFPMPLPPMIKREFDLDSFGKMPFGQQTDSLGRPSNLIFNQTYRIRKTNRDLRCPYAMGFA